jgi:hypothetical protein
LFTKLSATVSFISLHASLCSFAPSSIKNDMAGNRNSHLTWSLPDQLVPNKPTNWPQ